MTTVTVQLPDDVYSSLLAQARSCGVTVEALIAASAEAQSRLAPELSPEAQSAMTELIEKYRPVFRRLAQ
jgi:phosphatidylserine/phosphatidylglycerophosphate/cardiolipin synthase-like enzyme